MVVVSSPSTLLQSCSKRRAPGASRILFHQHAQLGTVLCRNLFWSSFDCICLPYWTETGRRILQYVHSKPPNFNYSCHFLCLKLVSLWMQEFIYCIVPLVFKISFTAELPLAMNILHSLLEDFLWHYYYSKAYSGLFKFLGHARQFRNSAIKLSASVIFKKSLATLKGPGFELESSEVPFIFYAFHFFLLVSH